MPVTWHHGLSSHLSNLISVIGVQISYLSNIPILKTLGHSPTLSPDASLRSVPGRGKCFANLVALLSELPVHSPPKIRIAAVDAFFLLSNCPYYVMASCCASSYTPASAGGA
jgi:hypothetical protein